MITSPARNKRQSPDCTPIDTGAGLEFTRCRPYRKNEQAHVEQKNGAVVRRIVSLR